MAINSILIDVNAYTEFKKGNTDAIKIIGHVPKIILNPVILGELWGGFLVGTKEEKNREELELFLKSERVILVNIDMNTGKFYSKIYKELRLKGRPIPTNDLWIAATAKQYDAAIFTYDKHFSQISDLTILSNYSQLISERDIL